ncbi:MAG: HNH endonuclease [bacterium]|nr:HNH endonuclease [bacterium]
MMTRIPDVRDGCDDVSRSFPPGIDSIVSEISEQPRSDAVACSVLATPAALALHNNFRTSVQSLRRSLVRSMHFLVVIQDRKVHPALGYATITDYAAAVAGFTRNQTEVFLALGRRLGTYPEVRAALERGDLSWSQTHVIVTQVAPADAGRWVDAAGKLGASDMKAAIRGSAEDSPHGTVSSPVSAASNTTIPMPPEVPAVPVSAPTVAPAKPPPLAPANRECHVSFALSPEAYAEWGAHLESLRKQGRSETGAELFLAAYAALVQHEDSVRQIEHGPRYLLVISRCPDCGTAEIRNSRGRFEAPPALLEAAHCDALRQGEHGLRRAAVPPRIRRAVLARDGHRCQAPGCRNSRYLEVHHRIPVAAGGKPEPKNLVTLCSRCHRALHQRELDLRAATREPAE